MPLGPSESVAPASANGRETGLRVCRGSRGSVASHGPHAVRPPAVGANWPPAVGATRIMFRLGLCAADHAVRPPAVPHGCTRGLRRPAPSPSSPAALKVSVGGTPRHLGCVQATPPDRQTPRRGACRSVAGAGARCGHRARPLSPAGGLWLRLARDSAQHPHPTRARPTERGTQIALHRRIGGNRRLIFLG